MAANGSALIRLEDVTKVFFTDEVETHALAKINLEVRAGEFLSVAGPSGCSTTRRRASTGWTATRWRRFAARTARASATVTSASSFRRST